MEITTTNVKVPRIIICNSIAGCGKTTAAQYLSEKYDFLELSFADPIYEIARNYFGMETKDRQLLIDIGQKLRDIDPEVWIKATFNKTNSRQNKNTLMCISDCRQENEYEWGVRNGFLPIRIEIDRDTAIERLIARDGKCDRWLLDGEGEIGTRHIPMISIDNNGTPEDLYKKLDELILKFCCYKEYVDCLRCGLKYQDYAKEYLKALDA